MGQGIGMTYGVAWSHQEIFRIGSVPDIRQIQSLAALCLSHRKRGGK